MRLRGSEAPVRRSAQVRRRMIAKARCIVTGATGQSGRLVIDELLQRVPASEVVAAVRHPEKADDVSLLGVTVRACDYDDPATLADVFTPGDRVLLISSNDFVNSVAQHTAVVQAARTAGVSQLAYTSLFNAAESELIVAQPHRGTEPVIRESGVPYTLLRNNLYSEHFAPFARQALQSGSFASSTRDGRVASASRRDLAAAAAAVLTEPGHERRTYELSGDVAWDNVELVETLSVISGTEVRLQELTSDEHRAAIVAAGFPAPVAAVFVNTYEGIAGGQLHAADMTLSALIGRPTTTLAQTLTAALSQSPVAHAA
jgi:NAD(P)H dehydrogenase (quinone)